MTLYVLYVYNMYVLYVYLKNISVLSHLRLGHVMIMFDNTYFAWTLFMSNF